METASRKGGRRTARRLAAAGALTAAFGSALVIGTADAGAVSNISDGPIDVLQGVGAAQDQRNVSWYFPSDTDQALEIEPTSALAADRTFTGDKTVVAATKSANGAADSSATDGDTKNIAGIANQSGYVNAHATVTGLLPSTKYSYHVGAADGSKWSATYDFTTPSASDQFAFDFFGDPQVGSSGHPAEDGAGWAATLDYATAAERSVHPELLVSGGDQVEHANNEFEWSSFADSSDVLKQYPWASTIGNHDVGGKAYEQHNLPPNYLKSPDFYPGGATSTSSGGDYFFLYKGVLFIDLNSNAYAGGADAEHVGYVRDVIGRVGDAAKWTVLVYHHSIYSPADHANDTDNQQRRFDFTKAFSDLGVDLVLQGHDHSYSRSYSLLNAGKKGSTAAKANPAEQPGQSEVFPGPGGVIYVTANSASGSKYYDLTTPTGQGGYGEDAQFPEQLNNYGQARHWANSVENQEHVRTYIQVQVQKDKLDVQNIRSGDCAAPNPAVVYGTVGTKFCGKITNTFVPGTSTPDNTSAGLGGAIGSLVDQFDLNRFVTPTGISIAGVARVNQRLAAKSAGAFSAGTAVTYKWLANGTPFATGPAVTLAPAQLGKRITVVATGTLLNYDPKTLASAATPAVAPAPLTVGRPTITGTAKVHRTLTATSGAAISEGHRVSTTLRYRWYVGDAPATGLTTSRTFAIPNAARGKAVRVVVVASKTGYSVAVSASAPTKRVTR